MSNPQDSVPDWTIWSVLAGAAAILARWLAPKISIRNGLAWLNEPTMRPVHAKLDRICRVIDKLPGAEEAHEAVRKEDHREKHNWED